MNQTPGVLWIGRHQTYQGFKTYFEKLWPVDLNCVDPGQVEAMKGRRMEVVLVESLPEHERTCRILEDASARYPDSVLLLHISEKPDPEKLIQYMNYGVRDVLTNDDNPERVLRKALALVDRRSGGGNPGSARAGRAVGYFSSKGGVGKTFLSVSTACLLGRYPQIKTVLVDLNLQFGDVDLYLSAGSVQTLGELVEEIHNNNSRLTDFILDNHIHRRSPNLHVLSAPLSPEKSSLITGQDVGNLIKLLKQRYDWIVLDAGAVLNEVSLAAFDHADRMFVVVNDEIASVKNAGQTLQLLKKLSYAEDRFDVAVNRFGGRYTLNDDMLRNILSRTPYARIPESAGVGESINEGYILAERWPGDPAVRGIQDLISKLAAEWGAGLPAREEPPPFLSRVFSKKAA
ncbi:AAA family ATPase [bacterium]|nr:AAA family ATPase [bacterium]